MLAAASLVSSYTLPALRGAPSLAARAPAPSMSLDVASQLSTLLASDASAVPLDAPFISQLGSSASLFVGGNVLHSGAFGEVEEPQEVGVEEGVIDIYRDSPLRYMGYANECGEAFRPIVPVIFVILSYVAAISYVRVIAFSARGRARWEEVVGRGGVGEHELLRSGGRSGGER